jgi:signal transduction histidine kinase
VVALHNKQENCNIEMHAEAKDVVVNGDRKWISRALSNIIINGIQASGEQGHSSIVIRLYRLGRKARIEIEDNGEGIPEDIRDKVFQLNFSTKFTGSGIGLAMAKRGVEFAGGRIWFESTVGVGTVFYIELPID